MVPGGGGEGAGIEQQLKQFLTVNYGTGHMDWSFLTIKVANSSAE